ncbi:DegT/DnrJ/EryC1/StrS family aminotransferase [Sphingobium bisphenolivorans]|uniref:DegT/DnrJ/EryC1/StrS family aminotransferase n=1 Tax=Sphingobium bisphenolivorans TaxID=1335760 RepID=UPI0003A53521|nr:DegT/DnrJ/EryC1/StrS family aminotransferase [Sphingobium bisphenolivorans]
MSGLPPSPTPYMILGEAAPLGARPSTPFAQPSMPPLEAFRPYLEQIWSSGRLTGCGPFHEQLETALEHYLGVENLALTANGTIGLLLALNAFDLDGEVITTPFSFVSTVHALRWSRLKPVFVDIDPLTGNLDPSAIEAAISPRTRAILPVHCFGHPCDTTAINEVADIYGLKVIYDAAHAFGVSVSGRSILSHGDASVLSFHAAMPFTCGEGGAVVCADPRVKRRIGRLRNFGLVGTTTVAAAGINGQMSEMHAALGLLQLAQFDHAIVRREQIAGRYRAALADIRGVRLFGVGPQWRSNHGFFPIAINDEHQAGRNQLYERLMDQGIEARRYGFPLASETPVYRDLPSARAELPHARSLAKQILCLPLYPCLPDATVERIIALISEG